MMNKQMLESFDRMCKNSLPQKNKLVESAANYEVAFIDVSGSNAAPSRISFSEQLAKNAGAQKLIYFAGKIGTTPEEASSNGTYYKPIQKYLDDNNISKAIVVTDEDVEMDEDGKDLQKDSRVTIIRSDIEERNRLSKKPATRKPETFDQRISRIKRTLELYKKLNTNANDFKPGVNSEGKEQVLKALPSNYAKTFKNYDLYLTDDFNVVGYLVPDKKKIVVNGNLSIQDMIEVVKHELDNLNKNGLKEATGYTWFGDAVKVRDYDQDLITTEDIVFYDVSDNYETFDPEEMMASDLYDEDDDKAIIPEGTTLIFNGMDRNGTHGVAVYSLPEYDDIEIRIYFDYWREELQYQVKPLKSDWEDDEEYDDEEEYRYQYFLNDDPLDEFTDEDEALDNVLDEIKNAYLSDDEYGGELNYITLYRAEGNNDTGECIESWQDEEVIEFLEDNGFSQDEILRIVDPDYLEESLKPNKKQNQLNQLKESLSPVKFNKIQKLIKECLKEGIEVEISIPKSKCKRNLNESNVEKIYKKYPYLKPGSPEQLQYEKEYEEKHTEKGKLKRILKTKLQDLEDHIGVMHKKHVSRDDLLDVFEKYPWVEKIFQKSQIK